MTEVTLFQSSLQDARVSRTMENRDHCNKIRLNAKENSLLFEYVYPCSTNGPAHKRKLIGISLDALECGLDFARKPSSQSRLLRIIPNGGVFELEPSLQPKDYFAPHARCLSLSSNSARICSHGTPLSGLRLNSSARRSSSSICSGDKSSSKFPNSSRIWPATSRRSFSGKRRICSKISVALTTELYRRFRGRQATCFVLERQFNVYIAGSRP